MPDEARISEGNLDDIRIMLNLERLGELIAHTAAVFAHIRGIEPPDFDGQEMRDLAVSGWRHVVFMADRVDFEGSVKRDLESLNSLEILKEPAAAPPQHRPEFGL